MTRWLLLVALAIVSAGCQAPGNVYAPYGPTCVPPPGTGGIGAPYYQTPYQAPTYNAPYGAYPAGTYPATPTYQAPTYQAPTIQGSTSRTTVPGGPFFAGAPPVTISPYLANEGAWSSAATVSGTSGLRVDSSTAPLQPRPSGQVIASGARFHRNENLNWNSSIGQASATIPDAAMANSAPTIAPANYHGAVQPSGVVYDSPVQFAAPTYYPNDYVLDPYATTYGPYATESIGTFATAGPGWTPRR